MRSIVSHCWLCDKIFVASEFQRYKVAVVFPVRFSLSVPATHWLSSLYRCWPHACLGNGIEQKPGTTTSTTRTTSGSVPATGTATPSATTGVPVPAYRVIAPGRPRSF
eukprot:1293799-Rhodomonas_salina.5